MVVGADGREARGDLRRRPCGRRSRVRPVGGGCEPTGVVVSRPERAWRGWEVGRGSCSGPVDDDGGPTEQARAGTRAEAGRALRLLWARSEPRAAHGAEATPRAARRGSPPVRRSAGALHGPAAGRRTVLRRSRMASGGPHERRSGFLPSLQRRSSVCLAGAASGAPWGPHVRMTARRDSGSEGPGRPGSPGPRAGRRTRAMGAEGRPRERRRTAKRRGAPAVTVGSRALRPPAPGGRPEGAESGGAIG